MAGNNSDDINKKIQQLQLQASTSASAARDLEEAKQHNYEFWTTQPVPQLSEYQGRASTPCGNWIHADGLGETTSESSQIKEVDLSLVRKEPYSLPEQFAWS